MVKMWVCVKISKALLFLVTESDGILLQLHRANDDMVRW